MKKNRLLLLLFAFLTFRPTAWAQTPTPSTALEPLFEVTNRAFYKFNYLTTSATGDPVVLSSLLACWDPDSPQSGDSIESVHILCHYTITANSQCPTSMTESSFDYITLVLLMDGSYYDADQPFRNVVTRSIVIMPDYEGYGVSSDRTHPYLAEEATAKQVVDAVTYGLELYNNLAEANSSLPLKKNWRSFSLGYSQGGSVSLAVQRHIEQNNLGEQLHFRGTLCGDGPYDLIATLRYYMEDNGDSYGVSTDHLAGQATLPVVLPMILKGMIDSDPIMANHTLQDYLSESFLATGIMDWLASKTLANGILNDDINTAWLEQLHNGYTVVNGTTYNAPANMDEMFVEKTTVLLLYNIPVVWANLDKVLTPGFYSYLNNPDNFNSVPAATGDPYQDMHHALAANNVTDWEPSHRIQFMHSMGDMVVPYGNYLAFRDVHPDGENDMYCVDATFSSYDHQRTGYEFMTKMSTDFIDYFEWIDCRWTGQGTQNSPYLIASTEDWNYLAEGVSSGNTYIGKYFQLTADINVTNMVGGDGTTGNDQCFSGIFDGQGHTITFNVANATEQYIAPFRRIDGATIDGVKLEGTVSSSNRFAGGIVAYAKGTSTIANCVNSTSITTITSNASNGGIVGMVGASGTITITGCVFNGEMNGATNSNETWSGILGLCNTNCTATINDCLVDPVSAVAKGNTIHRTTGHTDCSNCYYTKTIGNAQGKQVYSITGGTDVTVANSGTATNYTVSGITSYGTGIEYNGTLYAGDGDSVSLNLTLPDGYTIGTATYTPEGGTATEMVFANGVYSFTMPNANVTINATYSIEWPGNGESWETAYLIYATGHLNLLATRVNGSSSDQYNTKYYKLMNDIEYTYTGSVNENNYTSIGNDTHPFCGHFEGQGYTISGIRINKSGNTAVDKYQGLFGCIDSGGEVKNVTLTDSDITGHQYTGGIAGYNGGTISNCQVTSSVYIRSVHNACPHHGGIAGINKGTSSSTAIISHCTSSATLTHTAEYGGITFGGIAGENQDYGLLTDNLAIGATIPNTLAASTRGAIVGLSERGEMTHNYYMGCTVDGVENAIGVGCNNADITTNDGAVPGNVCTVPGYNNSNGGWVFIASPVLDEGGIAPTSVTNLVANPKENYDLYRFNQSATLEWENYKQTGDHYNFNLDNGKGYLYANKDDVTLIFLGTTFNTDIEPVEMPLDYIANTEFAGWNLVGNPFPRAAYVNRSYYVTDENGTIITPVSGSNSTAIRPCTGVMVHTDHANDRVTFSTTAPETTSNRGNLQIALSQGVEAVRMPSYRVGPSTSSGTLILDKAILSFNEGDQLAKFVFNADRAKLYIPQNGKDYAIATTEGKGEMPVNFKATEDGTYTLTVNIESVEMEYLHLIDNLTGADVDLLQTPSYTFTAKTTDYESRFKLVFAADEAVCGPGEAFAFISDGNIIVNGTGTLQVIDMTGRVIFSGDAINRVSTSGMTPGVYVLRLIDGNDVRTQKIVVR